MLAKKWLKITCSSVVITWLAAISSLLTKAGTNNIPSPQPTSPLNYKAQQLGHENLSSSSFFRFHHLYFSLFHHNTKVSEWIFHRRVHISWSMEQNPGSKHSNLKPLSWFSVIISIAEEASAWITPNLWRRTTTTLCIRIMAFSKPMWRSGSNTLG